MKKIFFILSLILFKTIYSQEIIVVDSLTHSPIPFVNVTFNNNNGNYTNENGIIEVNKNSNNKLRFTHIAYNDYEVNTTEVQDTVKLSTKFVILKEVKILNFREEKKYINLSRKNISFNGWPISPKSELVTLLIPNKNDINSLIKKLNFFFIKKRENISNHTDKTAIRINLYNSTVNSSIKENIYSSQVFIINPNIKDQFELDLENEYIEFSLNGLYIGIEVLGDIDNLGNLIKENSYIRPKFSDSNSNEYTSKSFIRNIFDNSSNLISINSIIQLTSGKTLNRYLSLGLTLVK